MNTYMKTDAGLLNWKDYGGEGPTIVLVHGLGGSLANWDAVGPRIAGFGRTVALDLPGFGLSPPGPDWTIETHAAALVGFLDTLETPVTLIGNSMGGLVSEVVAADHPDLVANLLLVSPATPPRFPDSRIHWPTAVRLAAQATPGVGQLISKRLRNRLEPRQLVEFSLSSISHHKSRIPPTVVENLVETSEIRYQFPWAVNAVPGGARAIARTWRTPSDFVAMIRRITCPTLVVHGVEDRIISPTAIEWLVSLRSDWELIQLDDTGHTPQLDAPVRFVNTITPWLASRI